jgi:hypothetical protein
MPGTRPRLRPSRRPGQRRGPGVVQGITRTSVSYGNFPV